jgi:hydroxypyruvate reductase
MRNLRSVAKKIFRAALSAVDPDKAVRNYLSLKGDTLTLSGMTGQKERHYDLSRFKRIFVVGAGKAAVPMARACEDIFQKRIQEGIVITKYGHSGPLRYIKTVEAGHPVPDESGLAGAKEIVGLLKACRDGDLVICLTSGGCSALLPLPSPPVTLSENQKLTGLLLRSGATIHEINAVRKHISMTKGGNLAKLAYPATVINLILSDVIGDNLDIIGSGPFVADSSTFQDAWDVLAKYGLTDQAPKNVIKRLQAGRKKTIEETPKQGNICFRNVGNVIIGSNLMALKAAETVANKEGFHTLLLSSRLQGEARELAKFYAAIAQEIGESRYPYPSPVCILGGGEPTVTVRGKGRGGRNTELALACAIEIQGLRKTVFLAAGTDGTDGPTDAAGAVVNGLSYRNAVKRGIEPEHYLEQNDSYTLFQKTRELLMTGPTRTNVMDVHVLLVGS